MKNISKFSWLIIDGLFTLLGVCATSMGAIFLTNDISNVRAEKKILGEAIATPAAEETPNVESEPTAE